MRENVEELINQKNPDALMILLSRRDPILLDLYPWTLDLLDEEVSPKDVADLLLRSEHLQWEMPDEALENHYQDVPEEDLTGRHQFGCAHQMCKEALHISQSITIRRLGEIKRETGSEADASISYVTSPPSSSDSGSVTDDTDIVNKDGVAEQHEKMVLDICGLAGISNPAKRGRTSPGLAIFHREAVEIIYGNPTASLRQRSPSFWQTFAATAIPHLSIGLHALSLFREPSESNPKSAVQIAFSNLTSAFRMLHRGAGCCDHFSILLNRGGDNTLDLVSIPYSSVTEIENTLADTSISSVRVRHRALRALCIAKFKDLGWTREIHTFTTGLELLRDTTSDYTSDEGMHLCALLAQMFSVGLATYCRGHSRNFNHDELSRSVEEFKLQGISFSKAPSITAKRVQLKCLGHMLRRKVWAFSCSETGELSDDSLYSVRGTIEDVCDLWGGNIVLDEESGSTSMQLQIGEGVLCESATMAGCNFKPPEDLPVSAYLHYSTNAAAETIPIDLLNPTNQVLIGGTWINKDCKLPREACHAYITSRTDFFPMGTRPPSWKTTGRSAVMSGGPKGISFSVGMSQSRDNGRTLKADIIEKKFLKVLNSPWGLELSLCTGIARRVPLRKLLYGEVIKYLKLELDEWDVISDTVGQLAGCSNGDFATTISSLDAAKKSGLKKVTELLLLAMEHTGNKDGNELVLWWPEDTVEPRGLRINKEWFAGRNPWLPMIQDSEHCAIFGLITNRCLQHDGFKTCQHPERNILVDTSISVPDIVLDTSVSILRRRAPCHTQTSFEVGQRLVWWKERDLLRDVLLVEQVSSEDGVARLKYRGRMPRIVLKALRQRYADVRELQAVGDSCHQVLILHGS